MMAEKSRRTVSKVKKLKPPALKTKQRKTATPNSLEAVLHKIYYNFGSEGALNNSTSELLRLLRERGYPNANRQDVINFLQKQANYTVHRRISKKQFPRRHIRIAASKIRCDADLIEVGDLASWNDDYKYILIAIDGFSKYVYAEPLKRKESKQTAEAFEKMLKVGGLNTLLLYTDAGKEFIGEPFQSVLRKYKIKHRICTSGDFHCPFVERVIRTIKEKLFPAMTSQISRRWLELLPKIVSTYNSTRHSSTGMRPYNAKLDENVLQVYNHIKKKQTRSSATKYKLNVGDYVRILKGNSGPLASKGYLPRFTWEIFQIKKRADDRAQDRGNGIPPAYILQDLQGEVIQHAVFYEAELSRVDPTMLKKEFPIREILEEKGNRIKVWWHGKPKKEAEWINRNQLVSESSIKTSPKSI